MSEPQAPAAALTPEAVADMVALLRQRAEDEPGHHNGITPWPECNSFKLGSTESGK